MAWYRLYRPRKIEDLNITSVRESLQRMMKDGKIPQSLLFAGPKGTGKTSASRILGAMLNDPGNAALVDFLFFKKIAPKNLVFAEPDGESDFSRRVYEGHSFVVQELDAASNRRIDDIRLLKERINLPPSDGKMTVYILDEVHMLTNEAFNALLKILEEPPAHVVFILATTELHKLPATIVSRCSVVNFRKATILELKQALERVLKAEKIKFADADLEQIATRADGSFRDGVKILEMACKDGQLDLAVIKDLLSSDNEVYVKNLLDAVMQKDEQGLLKNFEELRNNNCNQKDFYKDFFEFLHKDLLVNLLVIEGIANYSTKIDQFFLKEILSTDLNQETPISLLVLELKLLEIIERSKKTAVSPDSDSKKKILKAELKKPIVEKPMVEKVAEPISEVSNESVVVEKNSTPNLTLDLDSQLDFKTLWQDLIKNFAKDNFSLLTLLKSCRLDSLSGGIASVSVYYSFHKEQLEQNKNKELLSKAAMELLGRDLKFDFVLQAAALPVDGGIGIQDSELMRQAKDSLL